MNRCIALACMLFLAACGRDAVDEHRGTAAGETGKPRDPAADEGVAAVLQTPGKAGVQMLFRLTEKPVLGKPASLQLDLMAAEAVPVLVLKAESAALELGAGAEASLALTEAGKAAHHTIAFTPRQAGWAELGVHLAAGNADGAKSAEIRYSIPLLIAPAAGSDKPDPATKSDHTNP
jgi:hypothetical protein